MTRTADLLLRWARWGCWAGLAICFTNVLYTFRSDFLSEPDAVRVVPLAIGVLVSGGALFSVRHLVQRRATLKWYIPSVYWKKLPRIIRLSTGVVSLGHIVNVLPLWLKGTPETVSNGYVLNNHGSITHVSYHEYLQVLSCEYRIVPILGIGIYVGAAALLTLRLTCPPGNVSSAKPRSRHS